MWSWFGIIWTWINLELCSDALNVALSPLQWWRMIFRTRGWRFLWLTPSLSHLLFVSLLSCPSPLLPVLLQLPFCPPLTQRRVEVSSSCWSSPVLLPPLSSPAGLIFLVWLCFGCSLADLLPPFFPMTSPPLTLSLREIRPALGMLSQPPVSGTDPHSLWSRCRPSGQQGEDVVFLQVKLKASWLWIQTCRFRGRRPSSSPPSTAATTPPGFSFFTVPTRSCMTAEGAVPSTWPERPCSTRSWSSSWLTRFREGPSPGTAPAKWCGRSARWCTRRGWGRRAFPGEVHPSLGLWDTETWPRLPKRKICWPLSYKNHFDRKVGLYGLQGVSTPFNSPPLAEQLLQTPPPLPLPELHITNSTFFQNGGISFGFIPMATILFFCFLEVTNMSLSFLEELVKVFFKISLATEVLC